MVAEMARQDQLANDLANVTTPGYKSDRTTQSSFGELVVTDLATGQRAGTISAGARAGNQVTNLNPAPIRDTGEPLDLAIQGEGWFAVQTPDGLRYTRNGAFQANNQGQLVDQMGNPVLGPRNQPVRVGADGQVNPDDVGVFAVPNARKVGDSYMTGNAAGRAEGQVRTGSLEMSGVDAARTMVTMMASLRAIEAGQRAITTIDESLAKGNSVGNLRG